jgi:hypothetical protein
MMLKSRNLFLAPLTALTGVWFVGIATTFGQGQITFSTHVRDGVISKVYLPSPAHPGLVQVGNGPTDFPPGTTDWTGWTPVSGNGFTAQLFAASGANVPVDSLAPAFPTATFLTGVGAGYVLNDVPTTFSNVYYGALATVQMRVWDNKGGAITSWATALAQSSGTEILGMSRPIDITLNGPTSPLAELLGLQSFNLTYNVPEPSLFAFLGLGGFLLWVANSRKGRPQATPARKNEVWRCRVE